MSELKASLLIAVMGATGAGKSTFINLASGSGLKVGYGLESCTSDVEVSTSLVLDGRLVTLIDTPGFDDSTKSEAEILRLIADFLAFTYKDGRKLNGIIFIHRISDYRMGGVARKNFRLFRKLCGDDALKNVVIATNMWGDVTEEVGAAREKELAENELFFKPALEKGAEMMRHTNTQDSTRRIIQRFLGTVPEVLSIQREVVDEKKDVSQTAAALEFEAELITQMEKHRKEMEEMKSEMEELMAHKDKKHREEIEELSQSLSDLKSQLARIENERNILYQAREAETEASEEKAKRMAKEVEAREAALEKIRQEALQQQERVNREMEAREAALEELREKARQQEARIDGLHETLTGVEQKARDQELQKKAMDEQMRAQEMAHQAELERVRKEFQEKLAESAKNERRLERPAPPPPPKTPWDVLREATLRPLPAPARGGFFREVAFIVDQLFSSRSSRL